MANLSICTEIKLRTYISHKSHRIHYGARATKRHATMNEWILVMGKPLKALDCSIYSAPLRI